MNFKNQLKWNICRKSHLQNFKKKIYIPNRIKTGLVPKTRFFIHKTISPIEEMFRKHLIYYLSKSIKMIFKICLISFCLKFVFYHLRLYHKAYIRDLSYMQNYGYARRTDYEPLMSGKSYFSFYIWPSSIFHSFEYTGNDPLTSFLDIFNKYVYHDNYGNEIFNIILKIWYHTPLKPLKHDFINILLNDYVNGEDFMESLYSVLKLWFLNDDLVNILLEKVYDNIFSEKVKYGLLDAFIYGIFVLVEDPEINQIKINLVKNFEKEGVKLFNVDDNERVDKAIKEIKRKNVYYSESPSADYFKLTDYNKFYLRTIYDFFLEKPQDPIIDFDYFEEPLYDIPRKVDDI